LDAEARAVERRRWAEQLFSYDSPQAESLIVELLTLSERPEVQQALCEVIVDRAGKRPERLDAVLVDPLISLLDAEEEGLRTEAAAALAGFPGANVPAKLGALAGQPDVPLAKRLAAIDALTPNIHRREVVQPLISLLDVGVPEITERVVRALEPASREPLGPSPERWRQWWAEKSQLSEEDWLADQVQMYRSRLRVINDQCRASREEARQEQAALIQRLREFQREVFRVLTAEQKRAKLTEWLNDPLGEVKLTSLGIIKAQIADEGHRPNGEVLAALLSLLQEGSPAMRREVLLIVQNLSDPTVIQAVLTQLEDEEDPATRHATLKAIGKLDRPEAIPALIREIASPESHPECVREAANALGRVAPKADDAQDMEDAVAALKARYALVAVEDMALRAALLAAMAGVGDVSFTEEFQEAVESDDANLLRPAIRGLRAIGDASKLPRLRDHTRHPDPLVRRAAIEAVGELGREDADLECLLTRLDASNEDSEPAREAAWHAVRTLLSNKPLTQRIRAAERLRDMPELELTYLEELAENLSATDGQTAELEVVRDRLAVILLGEGKYTEAVPHLRDLCQTRLQRGAKEAALETGLQWLDAALLSYTQHDTADVVIQLATSFSDEPAVARIVDVVQRHLESEVLISDPDRARAILAALESVPAESLPPTWAELLTRTADRLASEDPQSVEGPTPP
jgi:HEAT repeat protein